MQNAAPIQLQQFRDFGQIINTMFQFLRQNWKPIFRALVVVCLPIGLIAGFLMGRSMGDLVALDQGGTPTPGDVFFQMLPMFVGYMMMGVVILLTFMIVNEYVAAYHRNEHHGITTADLWKRATANLGPYVGIAFLSMILIMIGSALCYLPGIYAMVVLSLAFISQAVERRGVTGSMKRSNELIKDHWWETFGLIMVVGLIQTVILYALMIPFIVAFSFWNVNTMMDLEAGVESGTGFLTILFAIGAMFFTLLTILTYPMLSVAMALKYFSLAEEKEGLSLRSQIQGFEQA